VRLYVAGPMTGIPQFNFPAFDAVALLLRAQGHDVVSPAELDSPPDRALALASSDGHALSVTKSWGDFLSRDVKLLADDGIEGVVVLPGWETSRGARLETYVANALCGLPVFRVTHDGLSPLPDLSLFRAWTGEPTLAIHREFGAMMRSA
jgi:hypothetical protein